MCSHIFACLLILIGWSDVPEENELRWIYNNQGLWLQDEDAETEATIYNSMWRIWVFSIYWIWEVITTVGYGDRGVITSNPENLQDVWLTLGVEFFGLGMQAILIDTMTNDAFPTDYSFMNLVREKLEPLQIWINKIQMSNKPYYLDPALYKGIV
jgi:hypothetical protein